MRCPRRLPQPAQFVFKARRGQFAKVQFTQASLGVEEQRRGIGLYTQYR